MSGSTIGGFAGAAIGFWFGGSQGARWGFMIGSAIGGYVDPETIEGPRLTDAQTQTSNEGVPRAIVYGTACVAGNIIQCGPLVEHKTTQRAGKGGPEQTTFTYTRDVAIRICEAAPLGGTMRLRRVWKNDKLVYDASGSGEIDADSAAFSSILTFYSGAEDQLPDPTLEALDEEYGGGVGNVPAYRGSCYVVLTGLDVTETGGAVPQFRWEVASDAVVADNCDEYSTGAVYYFPLDDAMGGGAATEMIQGLDGTYSANCAAGPSLRAGSNGSLFMAANSDHMLANYSDAFRINPANGWTVGVWCRPTELSAGSVYKNVATLFAATLSGQCNYSMRLRGTNNMEPQFVWSSSGTTFSELAAGFEISENSTAFMCMTYTPTTVSSGHFKFYINGILVDEIDSDGPNWGGDYLAVGGYDFPESYGFIGYVSDLAVWDRAFSDEEVLRKYWAVGDYIPLPDVSGAYVSKDGEIVNVCIPSITPGMVALSDIVADVCGRVGVDASQLDVSTLASTQVRGFPIARQTSAAEAVRALQQVYFFDMPEWGNSGETGTKLRAVLRGGPVVGTITDDDLVDAGDDEDIRAQQVEFPRKVNLTASDPESNYEPITQSAERSTENVKAVGEASFSTNVVMTRDEDAVVADKMLKVLWEQALGRTTIELPEEFTRFTPSDRISYAGKLWRIDEAELLDGTVRWDMTRDRASAYGSDVTGSIALPPTAPASSTRGPTIFAAMNLPSLRSADNVPGVYLAAQGLLPGWVGADIYLSTDGGTSEQKVATITDAAVMGSLAISCDEDGADSSGLITVDILKGGELDSITDDQMAARLNGFALITDGVAEVGQFKTATEDADIERRYDLTDVLRGQLGTDAAPHLAGDRFVLLDGAVKFLPLDVEHAGKTLIFRAVSIGTAPANNPTTSIVFDPPTFIRHGGVVTA